MFLLASELQRWLDPSIRSFLVPQFDLDLRTVHAGVECSGHLSDRGVALLRLEGQGARWLEAIALELYQSEVAHHALGEVRRSKLAIERERGRVAPARLLQISLFQH